LRHEAYVQAKRQHSDVDSDVLTLCRKVRYQGGAPPTKNVIINEVFLFFNEQTPLHLPGIRHTTLKGSCGRGDLHAEVPRNTL